MECGVATPLFFLQPARGIPEINWAVGACPTAKRREQTGCRARLGQTGSFVQTGAVRLPTERDCNASPIRGGFPEDEAHSRDRETEHSRRTFDAVDGN
jgi:hypothetical protein